MADGCSTRLGRRVRSVLSARALSASMLHKSTRTCSRGFGRPLVINTAERRSPGLLNKKPVNYRAARQRTSTRVLQHVIGITVPTYDFQDCRVYQLFAVLRGSTL